MSKFRVLAVVASTVIGIGVLATPAIALPMDGAAYATASRPLYAEIQGKLDTKNASVGETVKAKVLAETVLGDNTAVPRGSILSGKVTEVQSKSRGSGTASLTIMFDQVQPGKKGSPIPIHGVLVGIAPKPYLSGNGPSASSLPLASTRSQTNLAGETGSNIDNTGAGEDSVDEGSSVRGVTLASGKDAGALTSSRGDFKIDRGMRIAVGLESN